MSEQQTVQEQPTSPSPEEAMPVTLGGQVIERHEDGSVTTEVFPITSSVETTDVQPAAATAEPETTTNEQRVEIGEALQITRNEDGSITESVPTSDETTAENPVSTETTVAAPTETPVSNLEMEPIAEVGVANEARTQTEHMPAKVGALGTVALLAAGVAARFKHNKKA